MTWMAKQAGGFPLYLATARGARVTDLDGHTYIDLCLGDTGAMAGHSPAPVVEAVHHRLAELGGATAMLPTEDAEWVGAELTRRFGLPQWSLSLTATDANRWAIRLARAITFFVDVMTGIPSIVAGLFAYALFAIFFGPGIRLGVMGAIALSVLMIPVVVRSAEEVLKLVPNELREASYALGVPKWRTIVKVVIPTAIAGLGTGVTLAIARVVGETAPLLITLGITNATNLNAFDGRMATLPVYAYYQLTQPGVPPQFATDRAWTAALVLIILVMGLNVVARLISRFFAPKTGR